jgi:hypothetical protein
VSAARSAAKPGETVLLSPACASFDQYPDFEARGEHFRALVEADAAPDGSDAPRNGSDVAQGGSDSARDGA